MHMPQPVKPVDSRRLRRLVGDKARQYTPVPAKQCIEPASAAKLELVGTRGW